jgi:hypothetical protein
MDLQFFDPETPRFCRRCRELLTHDNEADGWCLACATELAIKSEQERVRQ